MQQIKRETMDNDLFNQAERMAARAGMPLEEPKPQNSNSQQRKTGAEERNEWEKERQRSTHLYESKKPETKGVKRGVTVETGRSALSKRMANNSKPDLFMPSVAKGLDPKEFADGKKSLQDELEKEISSNKDSVNVPPKDAIEEASAKTSEIVAKAGSGNAFQGQSMGIGGLDDVLGQIKRRIWVPLAGKFIVNLDLTRNGFFYDLMFLFEFIP
jgi:hypothetical protein